MGSEAETTKPRKPRFMCFHGFRTNGHIFKIQLKKWPEFVLDKLDLVFPDAPFDCNEQSDVEGFFDPPYHEWFQFGQDLPRHPNTDGCLEYVQDCMITHGPIDGVLGFSQGAMLAAALPVLQAKGLALTKVPKIKFLIVIGGAAMDKEAVAEKPISIPSLHFLGENDYMLPHGTTLLESYVDPVVIYHPKGHIIPRLDEKGLELMLGFLEKIQKEVTHQEGLENCLEEAP